MKKIQHVPRRQALMGAKWSQQVYGKRHRAFQLITRAERLKNVVRIIVAATVMMGIAVSVYE